MTDKAAADDSRMAPEISGGRRHVAAATALDLLTTPSIAIGAIVLFAVTALAVCAPLAFTMDPLDINPTTRLAPPSAEHWLGTDRLGRDIYSRAIYGGRTSLFVGISVAVLSVAAGLLIGLVSGYLRAVDRIVMRIMDGLMAIPAILLAIALIAISGANLVNIVIAIAIPDVPRVVRLVRSVVLTVREEPYVEAAITVGTPLIPMLFRHVLPNTIAPLIVLASYICASAIISEAALSFLGAGLSPEIPSWGNMISEGRVVFQLVPLIVFVPGFFLSATVLGINILGDGLRDRLDPKLARRPFRALG